MATNTFQLPCEAEIKQILDLIVDQIVKTEVCEMTSEFNDHSFLNTCETEIKQTLDLIIDQIVKTEVCEMTSEFNNHSFLNTDMNQEEAGANLENLSFTENLLEKEKQPELAIPQIAGENQYVTDGALRQVKNVFAKALELLPCIQNISISAQKKSASLKLSTVLGERTSDSVDNQAMSIGKERETVHFISPIAVFHEYSESLSLSSGSTHMLSDEEPEGFDEKSVEVNPFITDAENTKNNEKEIESPKDEGITAVYNMQIDNSEFTDIGDKDTSVIESSMKTFIQTDEEQNKEVISEISSDMVGKIDNSHQQIIIDAEKTLQRNCRKNNTFSTRNTSDKNENCLEKNANNLDGVEATKFLPKLDKITSIVSTDKANEDDLFHNTDEHSRVVYDIAEVVSADRNYSNLKSFVSLQEVFYRAPDLQSGFHRSPDLFLESVPVMATEYSKIKSEIDKSSVSENNLTLKITDSEKVIEYKVGSALYDEDVSFKNGIHVKEKQDQERIEAEYEGIVLENQNVSSRSLPVSSLSDAQNGESDLECIKTLNEGSKGTENVNEGISKRKRKLFHGRQENEYPPAKAIKYDDLKQSDLSSIIFQQPAQLKVLACKALDHAEECVLWNKLVPGLSTNKLDVIQMNNESQTNSGIHKIRDPVDSVVKDGKLSPNGSIETNQNILKKESGNCCNEREPHYIHEKKLVSSEDKAFVQNGHVGYPEFITATDHLSQTSQGSSLGFIFDGNHNEVDTPSNSQASMRSISYMCGIQRLNIENKHDKLLTEFSEEVDKTFMDEAEEVDKTLMDEAGFVVMNSSKTDLEVDFSKCNIIVCLCFRA